MTSQRKLIYQIVMNSNNHPTARQIFAKAKEQMPNMVRATVYNNLNALAKEGQIKRIQVANGEDRYDKTVGYHGHLICTTCGKMTDIMNVPKIEDLDLGELDVVRSEFNVYYICQECQKK